MEWKRRCDIEDMKTYDNGSIRDMTEEEMRQAQQAAVEYEYQERIRPRTEMEGILALTKYLMNESASERTDKTLCIQCMALFDVWTRGKYSAGDVRTDPKTGYPYESMIEHDSTVNTDWTIEVRSIWKPYHSRMKEYALPWVQPTGAHDMYKAGEYMIWTDGTVKKCIQDTNFSPTEYPQAWEDA